MEKVLNYVATLLTVGTMVAVTMKLTGQLDYPWLILAIPVACTIGLYVGIYWDDKEKKVGEESGSGEKEKEAVK